MKLSRTPKIVVGAATTFVLLAPVFFMAFMFFSIFSSIAAGNGEPDPVFIALFLLVFPIMMIVSLMHMVLMVFYIAHIVMNKSAKDIALIILAVGLYIMPFFAMPAYYLIYIMPNEPPDWALDTTTD